jgi:methylated-DNA-[protein]-cysteine S-methyltransferase
MIYDDIYQSPLGPIQMIIEDEHLIQLTTNLLPGYIQKSTPLTNEIKQALDGYFHHQMKTFNIPIKLKGSPFQMRMYDCLKNVSYGQTMSYQGLAEMMGNPKATRAVGQALHNNPVMIFMPCHRIIGKNKRLTGYAGGLKVKAFLLNLESENML